MYTASPVLNIVLIPLHVGKAGVCCVPTYRKRTFVDSSASRRYTKPSTPIIYKSPLHNRPPPPPPPPYPEERRGRGRGKKITNIATMQQSDAHYPPEPCPFCTIAAAFPFPSASVSSSSSSSSSWLWNASAAEERVKEEEQGRRQRRRARHQGGEEEAKEDVEAWRNSIPSDDESDCDKTSPSSFVVLRSRNVVAFLDILPMTRGEFFLYIVSFTFPSMAFNWIPPPSPPSPPCLC